MSRVSGLETRRLDALPREKAVDSFTMDAQHAADADRIEPPVVNQAANRFGMDAELVGDVAHADQTLRISFRRRHASPKLQQESPDCRVELARRRASLRRACVQAAAGYQRNQRKGGKRSAHVATLELAAVVHAVRQERQRGQ